LLALFRSIGDRLALREVCRFGKGSAGEVKCGGHVESRLGATLNDDGLRLGAKGLGHSPNRPAVLESLVEREETDCV
jgi:hypothetical protein